MSTLLKSSYTVYMVYIERSPSRSSTMVMTLHIMEKFNINYSKKNVPAASRAQYKLMLTSKIEKVIKRMRWKVLEFLGKLDSNSNNNETYGFKCLKYPPAVEEMAQFENDLLLLIKNLEFKKVHNEFQMRLRDDIKEIKASNKMFVSANKLRHIYKMKKDEYKKLLRDNRTYWTKYRISQIKNLLVYTEMMDLLYYKTCQVHKLSRNVKIFLKCSKLPV